MDETIEHLVSSCLYLVQREYKRRHDCIASLVHYTLAKQSDLQCQKFDVGTHLLEFVTVLSTSSFGTFQLCLMFHSNTITFVFKKSNEVFLIAIPGDSRFSHKCTKKYSKYVDLKIEVACMWRCKKVAVVPIIVGALGSIPIDLSSYLEKPHLSSSLIQTFQKSLLFSTTSIIR